MTSTASPDLFGDSPSIRALQDRIERVARAQRTTLIQGPTGSGKEVVSRRLHALGGRSGPFVAVSCAAIPEALVESELFGHAPGAFTGALRFRPGIVASADDGTLLLDDVDALPPSAQAALLRFLDFGTYRPVGSDREQVGRCWVLASTNADLPALVRERRFREDLLFRLEVFRLSIPPLTERGGDVQLLADRFLAELAPDKSFSACARRAMQEYDWPGNVRELKHRVECGAWLAAGATVRAVDLELTDRPVTDATPLLQEGSTLEQTLWTLIQDRGLSLAQALTTCEKALLNMALSQTAQNRTRAAARLGINVRTLFKKLYRDASEPPETV